MELQEVLKALKNAEEVELTVTGRSSGRPSSRPVWFVQEGGADKKTLFSVPVQIDQWPASWSTLESSPAPTRYDSGWVMQADFRMAATPGAPLTHIPAGDTSHPPVFSLFPSVRSQHGTVVIKGAQKPPPGGSQQTAFDGSTYAFTSAIVITLGNGDVFTRAYPGLNDALQSALKLRITEIKDDKAAGSTIVSLAHPEFEFMPLLPGDHPLPDSATSRQKLFAVPTVTVNRLPAPAKDQAAGSPAEWLKQRVATGASVFQLSIVVSPSVEVPLEPRVQIQPKK